MSNCIGQIICGIGALLLILQLFVGFMLLSRGELTYKLRDKVESSLRSLLEEYSRGGDEFEVNSQEA
ncbi:hypothetical protein JHK87_040230 [Glycine soja]|nr:hypothetical protein JHK87_040230 [Glycine soja]